MQLKSRYILLVNLVILITMTLFFVFDDYRLQRSHLDAVQRGTWDGVRARPILDRIREDVISLVDPSKNVEQLRHELRTMRNFPEMKDVLEVRLTVSIEQPRIIASLTGENIGGFLTLSPEDWRTLRGGGNGNIPGGSSIIVGMRRYHNVWVTRVITPYYWYAEVDTHENEGASAGPSYRLAAGLIEVLMDSSQVAELWQSFRLAHLLYVFVFAITVTVFVDMATNRMVLRPLEMLTDIIRRAQAGEVNTRVRFPRNEVGEVSASLTTMLATMRRLHDERVANLNRLASGVAHEIRNPLNAISMSVQYLRDSLAKYELTAEQQTDAEEVLNLVSGEVKELNRITSQFLNLTRPTRVEWEESDINALLDKVLDELALPVHAARVTVHREYDNSLERMSVGVVQLRSAFYNILQNAVQAMPYGGSLYVTTRSRESSVLVEIRDTGVGIPSESLEKVFDPYFTTREREGGLGLGLALAKSAVEAHKGAVTIQSQVGVGTVVRITLPKNPRELAESGAEGISWRESLS
jgi:signal transduction histidine kinase